MWLQRFFPTLKKIIMLGLSLFVWLIVVALMTEFYLKSSSNYEQDLFFFEALGSLLFVWTPAAVVGSVFSRSAGITTAILMTIALPFITFVNNIVFDAVVLAANAVPIGTAFFLMRPVERHDDSRDEYNNTEYYQQKVLPNEVAQDSNRKNTNL